MYSAYRYQVHIANAAPDVYGVAYEFADPQTGANATTRFIDITIWDNPAHLSFSYDGVYFGDDMEIDPDHPPLQLPFAVRAFKIKNKTAGSIARWQVCGFW